MAGLNCKFAFFDDDVGVPRIDVENAVDAAFAPQSPLRAIPVDQIAVLGVDRVCEILGMMVPSIGPDLANNPSAVSVVRAMVSRRCATC